MNTKIINLQNKILNIIVMSVFAFAVIFNYLLSASFVLAEEIQENILSNKTDKTSSKFIKSTSNYDIGNIEEIEKELQRVEDHIKNKNLPADALTRLNEFRESIKPKENTLFSKLKSFVTRDPDQEYEERRVERLQNNKDFEVELFRGETETLDVSEFDKKFKNGELVEPLSSRVLKTVSSLFVIEKAIALTSNNPDDYLAEGNEIKFSQAIKDKADLLGPNPLAIFNFVKNNFEYEPYYGSKKGSADTFIEQSGNDVDKSALLIAMLRYKDIPARYRSVYARFDIRTINDLLGVEDANLGAEILTLNKIPNKLYAKNGEPDFFVLEYTYVEAYFPYGYTRGVDISDGGTEVWVPMDPTTNAIYFEQLIDTMGHMNQNGFRAEMFLENYLDNLYDTLTPVEAFISIASSTLSEYPPEYYPDMTFDDSLVKKYPRIQNLEFIPGSLPFIIAGSINKFDFYPELLRHYVNFQIKNENDDIVSQIKLYISDIANKEFLLTNKPATPIDQTIVDSFDTIYDVVPLSLVNIVPVVRIGGQDLLIGTTSYALGTNASYSVEFTRPQADDIFSDNRSIVLFKTHTQDYKNGNTLGIVINASNLVPSEITGNPNTNSYINDQLLYASALDYAVKNQETRSELESIIGGKYMSRGDKISISNNIKVTKQNNIPYSFSWSGLNIDAKLISAYYYRFGNINQYHKEIFTIALTEASLQESTIFESNFDVESVSTVKGLQKVNQGQFPNTTMSKITYQNKAHIDTLNISQSTKMSPGSQLE